MNIHSLALSFDMYKNYIMTTDYSALRQEQELGQGEGIGGEGGA